MGDHGRGSLKDLGDGKWRYWPPMVNGHRGPSKTFRAKTKREANQVADAYRSSILGGEITGDRHTVAELVNAWFDHRRDLSPASVLAYRTPIDKHVLPRIGHLQVEKVTTYDIDRLYRQLTAGQARKAHDALRQAFEQAITWGWSAKNPTERARKPAAGSTMNPPSPEQLGRILELADPETRLFLTIAALRGVRRGELCALRWKDVTTSGGKTKLHIAHTLTVGDDGAFVLGASTKTGKTRYVTMDAATAALLREHRGTQVNPEGWVFATANRPWNPQAVSQRFRRLADQVGYEGNLHQLRHFAATHMLANGSSVPDVAATLGHSTSATTMRTYAHALPGASDRTADTMADVLRIAR